MMEIRSEDLLSFNYYTYGESFTGSHKGMRYRLSRAAALQSADGASFEFEAAVWPEPYAEAFTDPQLVRKRRFAFTEEGKEEAAAWLNEAFAAFYCN